MKTYPFVVSSLAGFLSDGVILSGDPRDPLVSRPSSSAYHTSSQDISVRAGVAEGKAGAVKYHSVPNSILLALFYRALVYM